MPESPGSSHFIVYKLYINIHKYHWHHTIAQNLSDRTVLRRSTGHCIDISCFTGSCILQIRTVLQSVAMPQFDASDSPGSAPGGRCCGCRATDGRHVIQSQRAAAAHGQPPADGSTADQLRSRAGRWGALAPDPGPAALPPAAQQSGPP